VPFGVVVLMTVRTLDSSVVVVVVTEPPGVRIVFVFRVFAAIVAASTAFQLWHR
jgi:hypothetical protein